MQYKSARPCFNTFSKFSVGAIAFAAISFAAQVASATMTVTPISKIPNTFGVTLNNLYNSAYYYPIYITPNTGDINSLTSPPTGIAKIGVLDPLFSFLDLGTDPDPTGNMQTQDSVIIFNVVSTAAVTGQAVLTATMIGSNSSTTQFVPIIGFGTNNVMTGCDGSNGCLPSTYTPQHTGSHPFYYGVYYTPNTTFQVAISPTAFCESLDSISQASSYCTNGFFQVGGSTGPVENLEFNFVVFPSSAIPTYPNIVNSTTVPSGSTDTIQVNLDFVALNPQPVTPTSPTPTPSPSPTLDCNLADGVIAPSPGGFTLQGPQNFTLTNDPTSALAQLIVAAAPTPGPVDASVNNYQSNFSINGTANDGSPYTGFFDAGELASQNQYFGNFKNSTSGAAYYYQVAFLGEDPAGYIVDDGGIGTGSGGCTFPGVFSTSAVNGFLQQSKCFIATAAFRDLNSAPLVLLRAFRDQFLEHFSLGRGFVHWYYAWSPSAAEWLIDHPFFRFPVLLALIPLQLFAWLVLHPLMIGVLSLMAIAILSFGTLIRRSAE